MSHSFKAVGKAKLLSKTVEEQIEGAIRTKELSPGAKLPTEMELCEQFGVSRTVMREALRVLSSRGLISIEKGRGMFVNQISVDSVTAPMTLYLQMNHDSDNKLHVIEARQLIEPAIAAQCAIRHTKEDADRLLKDHDMLIATAGNLKNLSKVDMAFHLHIAEATHNPVIPLLISPIHKMMPSIKAAVYEVVQEAHKAAVEWHEKILKAILDRDPDEAFRQMTGHLDIAKEHILSVNATSDEKAA
ncbi:MAG: FadR/GntR family transcriptional regulator [Bacteroidota bacterium]